MLICYRLAKSWSFQLHLKESLRSALKFFSTFSKCFLLSLTCILVTALLSNQEKPLREVQSSKPPSDSERFPLLFFSIGVSRIMQYLKYLVTVPNRPWHHNGVDSCKMTSACWIKSFTKAVYSELNHGWDITNCRQ